MTAHPATQAREARTRIPLPRQANEREFGTKVLGCLEPWFKIDREVTGRHALDERVRIDAIIRPLDPAGWFDPDPAFGVEFKQFPDDPSARDPMRLAAQAIDYTYVAWEGHGRVGVFACTPGQGAWPVNGGRDDPNFLIARLLGQLTVGELCYLRYYGWTLLIHGWHRLWSEHGGVAEAKGRTVRPKAGSR